MRSERTRFVGEIGSDRDVFELNFARTAFAAKTSKEPLATMAREDAPNDQANHHQYHESSHRTDYDDKVRS